MARSPDNDRAMAVAVRPGSSATRARLAQLPLLRLCEVIETAEHGIGPRLAEGADGLPEQEASTALRVLAVLRHRPTAGAAELDQALEIIAGEPLTIAALRRVSEKARLLAGDGRDGPSAEVAFAQAVRAADLDRRAIAGLMAEHGQAVASLADGLRESMDAALDAVVWLAETPAREDGMKLLNLVDRSLPRNVAGNRRRNPLAPSFGDVEIHDREQWREQVGNGDADSATRLMSISTGAQPHLPAFETVAPTSVAPLDFYDLAAAAGGVGGGKVSGRGAPLTMRLFTEVLLNAPAAERASQGGARYVVTLHEITRWLWPYGWRRSRDLPKLREALIALDRVAVPFSRPPTAWESLVSGPGMWRPILVEGVLLPGDGLDSRFAIRVQLPPSAAYGPQVDRFALREAGLDSAPMYRTLLSLAYFWYEQSANGYAIRGLRGQLVPPPGPNESKRAVSRRRREAEEAGHTERNPAADRSRVLGPADRVALAYSPTIAMTPRSIRSAREKADRVLRALEQRGLVVIETCDADGRPLKAGYGAEGWRVLPGPRWLRGALQGAGDRA